MAHFAQINENNLVINVTVVADKDCKDSDGNESEAVGIAFNKALLGEDTIWLQTSYNSRIRKNYAGIGYTWDVGRDAFIPPKLYNSWQLDETTCLWNPPVPMPDDTDDPEIAYGWDEDNTQWVRLIG